MAGPRLAMLLKQDSWGDLTDEVYRRDRTGPAPRRAGAGEGPDGGPEVPRVDVACSPVLRGSCVGLAPPDGRGALTARLEAYA